MTAAFDRLLRHAPPAVITLLAILLIGAVGLLDYLSGFELSFQLFYLPALALAAWYLDSRRALPLALAAALVWLAAEWSSGRVYTEEWIGYWNGAARLLLFALVVRLVDAARRRLREEEALSDFDALTRLPNRRAFGEQLALEAARLRRYRDPFTVVYLHLGGLSGVRETMGDEVGDELLKQVAARLHDESRESDLLTHVRDNGFGALFPKAGWAEAQPLIRRLRDELADSLSHGEWPIEPRIGAITFGHGAGTTAEMSEAVERLIDETRRQRGGETIHHHWRAQAPARPAGRPRSEDA